MEILALVKQALRITSTATDGEIGVLISACQVDLASAGVTYSSTNQLHNLALILYAKSHYGLEANADYEKMYESLKRDLALCGATQSS